MKLERNALSEKKYGIEGLIITDGEVELDSVLLIIN